MKNNKSNNVSGGMGVTGALGVAFVVLKLLDIIEWSWLWVLSPFWLPLVLGVVMLVISIILEYIAGRM